MLHVCSTGLPLIFFDGRSCSQVDNVIRFRTAASQDVAALRHPRALFDFQIAAISSIT
jgi:hypothetical protein